MVSSSWIEALKQYSKKNGKYIIPKKSTKEYNEVKKIQLQINKKKGQKNKKCD